MADKEYNPIYAKRLNTSQRRMLSQYYGLCGLEPIGQEDYDAGLHTFEELWNMNVRHLHDIYSDICNIDRKGSGI